jgi:hypothetical protein
MELRNRWHCRDAISTQLRQLLSFSSVNIKAIHVADAEPLHAILRELLPLCS